MAILMLFITMMGVPGWVIVFVWVFVVFDIAMNTVIIVQVYKQFSRARESVSVRLRREIYKAVMATWLFESFAGVPKEPFGGQKLDAKQQEMFDGVAQMVVTGFVMAVFYPPLWVAWRDRQVEKARGEGDGEIELEEHRVMLVERRSVDTLDGLDMNGNDEGVKMMGR
ncbi:hypothetical protein BU23DRAFT_91462 [Bimuria novae-zelandiae CBS 107.79]|uniref:Uncharacterized protein n=1 Tax=Bimuria novae-zelandiae CBS 107.79 TaxID=1447943 RepID=A0A6A5VDM4_9PLEO|nr:hypothetical protein BU23DRAFT_91462 [Bimuria novae-zelandiae CBS 107.79]